MARAGTVTARYWGESVSGGCRYANGSNNSPLCYDGHRYTAPVGSLAPNAFELYDVRGGSWFIAPWFLRSANRCRNTPVSRDIYDGFRVTRTLR